MNNNKTISQAQLENLIRLLTKAKDNLNQYVTMVDLKIEIEKALSDLEDEPKELYISDIFDLNVDDSTPIKIMFEDEEYFLHPFEIEDEEWFFMPTQDEDDFHILSFGRFKDLILDEASCGDWSDDIRHAPLERVINLPFRMGFEENNNWDFYFRLSVGTEIVITMEQEY